MENLIDVRNPFPDYALPSLWRWMEQFRKNVADDYGPTTLDEFLDLELERTESGILKFGVWRDDELGGCMWAEPVNDFVVNAHCVFKKEFFGRKTTAPALVRMSEILFDQGYLKISMPVFADNNAVIALLKSLGALREGTLKRQTIRNGELVDMALFAFHRPEPKAHELN